MCYMHVNFLIEPGNRGYLLYAREPFSDDHGDVSVAIECTGVQNLKVA